MYTVFMYIHNFDLGTTPLLIKNKKAIDSNALDTIFKLIQFIRFDFNHTIHNSSGYRLNDAKIGVPFLVTPEFVSYLKLNLSFLNKSFNPFNDIKETGTSNELVTIYDHTLVKNYSFSFNTQVLLQPYLVDTIFQFLKGKKVKNFLVQTNSFFRADNKDEWEIEYTFDEGESLEDAIKGEASAVIYNNSKKEIPNLSGFANKDEVIKTAYAITKSESCIECKVKALELFNFYTDSGLKIHAQKNRIDFLIVDNKFSKKFYSPNLTFFTNLA